jgi:hypothetical protein
MSSKFSIPSKLPSLSAPKVPGNIKLPSATILSKGILSSPPAEAVTSQSPTGEETTETGEQAADTEETPTPNTVSIAKHGRVVYLVMQPVIAVSKLVADVSKVKNELKSSIYRYIAGLIDFTTLLGMLVAQHWAVRVDDRYYHLKRQTDDSLALDMSPFDEDAIFLKIPLWKTTFSHEENAGIGESQPFVSAMTTRMRAADLTAQQKLFEFSPP